MKIKDAKSVFTKTNRVNYFKMNQGFCESVQSDDGNVRLQIRWDRRVRLWVGDVLTVDKIHNKINDARETYDTLRLAHSL